MQYPLLYSYRRCPYAIRARMALLVAGILFDVHEVSLGEKPPAMLALSPKGSVPVLLLPGGQVLEESRDIMGWALARPATQGWWAAAQTTENLAWLASNDGDFKHHLDRYKYPERYFESDRSRPRDEALNAFLLPLASRLKKSQFLGGSEPCATDVALFPFVRQFAAVAPVWFAQLLLPSLQSWLANWLSSALFRHCMHKLPSQTTVLFPLFASPTTKDRD
jgi:glutathione S-transferase